MTYIPEYVNADAFGRTRISQPYTLFDSSFRYDDDYTKWATAITDNSGNCSKTFNANEGVVDMALGTTSGDQIIRETTKVFAYQPGKSLLILNTFTMEPAKTGLRQRVGYFGEQNGIFLELDGDTLYFVKRSYKTGEAVDTRVAQADWSEERLDGTDGSGITLDITKSQIFWIDVEWLGVGSVRCGFVHNGNFYHCHSFHHANEITSTYMTTASLPVRYEITNTATTDSASNLKHICNSVISEGGFSMRNRTRSVSTTLTGKNIADATKVYPLISLRLSQAHRDCVAIPSEFDLYGIQAAAFKYVLIMGGTLTGASWQVTDSGSNVDYDLSATAITGGTQVLQGIFYGQTSFSKQLFEYNGSYQLTRGLDGGSGDVFTLAARATTNNDDVIASLTWMEHIN